MNTALATDDVIDSIAQIEMHRQTMAKESDAPAAGAESLRKLHELLEHERSAQQANKAGASHPLNIQVIANEIERIKYLTGMTSPRQTSFKPNPQQHPAVRPNPPHNPDRSNLRRTMGRRGDR